MAANAIGLVIPSAVWVNPRSPERSGFSVGVGFGRSLDGSARGCCSGGSSGIRLGGPRYADFEIDPEPIGLEAAAQAASVLESEARRGSRAVKGTTL